MKTLVYFRLIAPRTALAGLLLLTGVGCAARPSGTELDDALKKAGVAEAIVFKVHGDAVNVGRVPASDVLTLPDAICRTLRTDPDVQAALAQVRVAEAESDQQRLLPNPVVSILARFPENSGKPVIEAEVGIELLSLLERPGRIRVADNRLRGASADVVGVVLDKIADVEERYASIQSLDAQMPVLEEQRQRLDRFVRLAQDRLNKGEATRLDVTALETQQLDLEVETAQKRLALRQARLALARLLGEPSGDAAWKLTSWDAPQTIGSEKSWVTTALLRRPEIQSQRWELAALGVETRLARYSVFEGTGVGAKSERDDVWTVGPSITVPVPLFDWGQAKRAKAAALQSEAEHNLTKAQRTVIEEVRSAFAAYAESTAATTLARDRLVPAQERRRKETEEAYTSGQTDVTSLVVADADLLASKIKLIELEEQASGSLVKLERAVGGSSIAAELEHREAPAPGTTRPDHVWTNDQPTTKRSQ